MKERPILFNAEMVKAILDGRKTQTRRVINPQPVNPNWDGVMRSPDRHCRYGQPGESLWVRETHCWADKIHIGYTRDPAITIGYKADLSAEEMGVALDTTHWNWDMVKWRPSIHMHRWTSRTNLNVLKIGYERVQDISEKDAIAEGWPAYRDMFPKVNAGTKARYWFRSAHD